MFWYLELWKRRKAPAMVRKPAQKADWRKYWWWHAGSRASINTLPVHLCTNIIHWNALRKCWWVCRIRRLVCMWLLLQLTSSLFVWQLIMIYEKILILTHSIMNESVFNIWIAFNMIEDLPLNWKKRMSLDYIVKLWTYRHTIFTHHI